MPPPKRPADGLVVAATRRDLKNLPKDLADSSLAASALVMAQGLDDVHSSLTSKTMAQARLADTMRELRELAPPKEAKDGIDDLEAKRAARRAAAPRSPRAANPKRP